MPVWFAANETRPLLAFAGIWTNSTSVRKAREGEVTAYLYGFFTCEPNAEVVVTEEKEDVELAAISEG